MFPLDTVKVSFILITEIYRLTYKLVVETVDSSKLPIYYIEMKACSVFGRELRSLRVVAFLLMLLISLFMKTSRGFSSLRMSNTPFCLLPSSELLPLLLMISLSFQVMVFYHIYSFSNKVKTTTL